MYPPKPPLLTRSIPAWAGETWAKFLGGVSGKVYPRVGGGNWVKYASKYSIPGLSPRGRGKPHCGAEWSISEGSIPAWAGETSRVRRWRPVIPVYPRVGGGN